MKLLIFFMLISHNVLAQDEAMVLEKVNKLDKALADSPLYKDCESSIEDFKGTKEQQDAVSECFAKELARYEDDEIQELGKGLDVSSFGVKDVKNANSIREFLTERLRKGLYGTSYDTKTKKIKADDRKQVGHDRYLELYKSQLSKTVLMEVNQYCLENLRLSSGESITDSEGKTILLKTPDPNKAIPDVDPDNIKSQITDLGWTEQKFAYIKLDKIPDKAKLKTLSEKANQESKTIGEFANSYNTEKDIEENKKSTGKEKFLAKKQSMCIAALNLMCTCYEKKCMKEGKHDVGQIACSVKSKIRTHRSKMEAVKIGIDELQKVSGEKKGFNSDNIKYYSGKGSGEQSIDELTNITSTEISDQVEGLEEEEIKTAQDELEACRTDINANENCEALFGEGLTEIRQDDIVKLEADKASGLEKINKLEAGEEFKKYLEDNGHKDLIAKMEQGLGEEEVRKIIKEKFVAEKQSIIDLMNEKLVQSQFGQKKKPPGLNTENMDDLTAKTKDEVIDEEKTKVEIKRDRFADVLHYSNVISSYLQLKDQEGNVVGQNTLALQQEYQQYQDGDEKTELENKYWENLTADANAKQDFDQNGSSEIDIPMIDRILGGDTSKEE